MAKKTADNTAVYSDVVASLTLSALSAVDGIRLSGDPERSEKEKLRGRYKQIYVAISDLGRVTIDVYVNVNNNVSVPDIVCAAQERIKREVEKSTKYTVTAVNVHVTEVTVL
jgi:uncharacterized alkaline shock family protein YloU